MGGGLIITYMYDSVIYLIISNTNQFLCYLNYAYYSASFSLDLFSGLMQTATMPALVNS